MKRNHRGESIDLAGGIISALSIGAGIASGYYCSQFDIFNDQKMSDITAVAVGGIVTTTTSTLMRAGRQGLYEAGVLGKKQSPKRIRKEEDDD